MIVFLQSTTDDFEEKALNLSLEQIQTLKYVDVIEFEETRYTVHELVFRADQKKFDLWVDKED